MLLQTYQDIDAILGGNDQPNIERFTGYYQIDKL